MRRPPPAVRVVILVAAVACLGLAMCVRSQPPPKPPAPAAQAQPPAQPDAGESVGMPMMKEPGKMGKKEKDRDYFPATKAPPQLYR